MDKKDIIRKLTSRKFWLAVASFVTMLVVYFTGDSSKAEQIASLIISGSVSTTAYSVWYKNCQLQRLATFISQFMHLLSIVKERNKSASAAVMGRKGIIIL